MKTPEAPEHATSASGILFRGPRPLRQSTFCPRLTALTKPAWYRGLLHRTAKRNFSFGTQIEPEFDVDAPLAFGIWGLGHYTQMSTFPSQVPDFFIFLRSFRKTNPPPFVPRPGIGDFPTSLCRYVAKSLTRISRLPSQVPEITLFNPFYPRTIGFAPGLPAARSTSFHQKSPAIPPIPLNSTYNRTAKPQQTEPTKPTPHIAPPKVGRNDPCPCGSGRKAKKCCHR